MNDMPRPPYLSKDNKGWKLRRNIPPRLQTWAAKDPVRAKFDTHSSIVDRERLHGLTWGEMCKQARQFAVETDMLFDKWERQNERSNDDGQQLRSDEPGFKFALSEREAEQIALAYFLERDKKLRVNGYVLSQDDPDYEDLLWDARNDLHDALRVHQGSAIGQDAFPRLKTERKVAGLLIKYEYILGSEVRDGKRIVIPDELRSDAVFQTLCRKVEEADIEIANRCVEALEKSAPPSISNQFFAGMVLPDARPQPYNRHTKTLKELTDAFVAVKQEEGLGKSRLDQYRIPIRLLHEEFGERTKLADIDVERCDELVSFLHTIPANYSKSYPGLTIKEAIAEHERQTGAKADRRKAAVDNLQILRSVFAVGKRRRWLAENPFADQKVQPLRRDRKKYSLSQQGYQPFTNEELKTIFSQPLYTGCLNDEHGFSRPGPYLWRRHRYWSNILAVWTGARMNEILQLERGDLKQHEDFWFISVTDEEEIEYAPQTFEKRLKNPNAVRDIPLHPRLIDYGFVEWAQHVRAGRLFPEALSGLNQKPSILFSKRSSTFLKRAGVWQHRKKVFHSYRGTFNDALRNGGINPEIRELINGWQRQHEMDAKYGKGHKLELMYEAICKLDCAGFDFDHLRPSIWRQTLTEKP